MTIMNDAALYIITSIVTVFITNFIYYDFFKNRYKKKFNTIFYILYLVIATIFIVLINQFHHVELNYLANISVFIILSYLFKFQTVKNTIINVSFLIFLALLDMISFLITDTSVNVFGTTVTTIDLNRTMLGMILESFLFFLSYSFIKSFLLKKEHINLKRKDVLVYVSISVFSWLFCYGLVVFSIFYHEQVFYIFSFTVTIIVLIFNVVFVSIEETISEKYNLENEIVEMRKKAEFDMDYYKKLEEKEAKNSLLLHDVKNHLQVLHNMVGNNELNDNLENYFAKIERVLELNKRKFFSENKVLEVLINDKIDLAIKKGIDVKVRYDNTDISFISEFDLVTILANMFDNAIDAAAEDLVQDKRIVLTIRKVRSYLVIKMVNTYRNEIREENNEFRTTKENHLGLGLKSIKNALLKYNATFQINTDCENLFEIAIIFPL